MARNITATPQAWLTLTVVHAKCFFRVDNFHPLTKKPCVTHRPPLRRRCRKLDSKFWLRPKYFSFQPDLRRSVAYSSYWGREITDHRLGLTGQPRVPAWPSNLLILKNLVGFTGNFSALSEVARSSRCLAEPASTLDSQSDPWSKCGKSPAVYAKPAPGGPHNLGVS